MGMDEPSADKPWRDKTFQLSIAASVTASLIVIVFIQPILTVLWGGLVWIATATWEGFLNSVYQNAAIGRRNYVDVFILAIIMIPYIAVSMRLAGIRPPGAKLFLGKSSTRINKLYRFVFVVLFLFLTMVLLSLIFADLQYNASFSQRVSALKPYVSSSEIDQLEAAWARMESRDDYLSIVERMDTLAQQKGATLPEPLLD
jgi:hypothetical protein